MSERGVWVFRDGQLIPKHLAPPLHRRFGTSAYVIGDGMEPTLNPANGRRYDSKRAYYRAVRDAGCEIIGNETPKASPRKDLGDPGEDIKLAIETVSARAPKRRKRGRL